VGTAFPFEISMVAALPTDILTPGCKALTSSSAVYTSKMKKCATSLSRDNYTIAKQRNVALFSARMQIASDDSKFFIGVLKSGATVPQSKK